jgi:hypothetical protein
VIKNQAQYKELAHMADMAEENLSSMRFGSHAFLMQKLRTEHGLRITDRLQAIREARRLCDEYLYAQEAE